MCFIKIELTTRKARFIKLGFNLRDEVFAMTYIVFLSNTTTH